MKRIIYILAGWMCALHIMAAQVGQWNAYLAYHDITDIEPAGNIVYVLSSNDLFSYNINDHSITTYSKMNLLSDTEIKYIAWSNTAKRLLIVYTNYNIDLLDNNGNAQPVGSADASWKRYIGNGAPKHTLSWTNSFEFHNFDLSVLFTGAFDYSIFNMRKYGMGLSGSGSDNVLRTAYTTDKYVKTGGGVITSYFLEDGSYFKLDNITLGYNWRWQDKLVDGLRLYVTAKNIYTLTRYSGNDPSIVAVTGITPGVDTSSAYPTATQLCLGVTLNLH